MHVLLNKRIKIYVMQKLKINYPNLTEIHSSVKKTNIVSNFTFNFRLNQPLRKNCRS